MAIDPTLASATLSAATRTNSTIAKPTGTVDGDFLLACIYVESDVAITAPAGWSTLVTADNPNTRAFDIILYYKRASGEGASWTWTHASAFTSGFVWRLTGVVASGSPEDATRSINFMNAANHTMTWSGITTLTAGSLVVGVGAHWNNGTLTGETMTERINVSNLVVIADLQASAGATGDKSGTWNDADDPDDRGMVLLALKEDTGGGAITGALTATLGALTPDGDGVVAVAGSATPTLGALTAVSAGTVAVAGAATPALGALTTTSAGTVAITGAAAVTLGPLTLDADATTSTDATGSLAATLDALTVTTTGTVAVTGTLSKALDPLSVAATGGAGGIVGDLVQTLGALTAAGAGTVAVAGTATPTLAPVTSAGAGTVSLTGLASITLGGLQVQLEGDVLVTGAVDELLDALLCQATGALDFVQTPGYIFEVADRIRSVAAPARPRTFIVPERVP